MGLRIGTSEDQLFEACRSNNRKLVAEILQSARDIIHRKDQVLFLPRPYRQLGAMFEILMGSWWSAQVGHTPLHVVCMNESEKAPEMAQAIIDMDASLALVLAAPISRMEP
eukprot:1491596-Rhodomonas_salina.7